MDEALRVLVVCTANICRSPAMEALLAHRARERGVSVEVDSAGFLYEDEPASEVMAQVLAERGLDISEHRSRLATCGLVEQADLVVTMERRHGRELSSRCGPKGIFTLRGLIDALEGVDPELVGARERLAAVENDRAPGDLLGDGSGEVVDPFGKSVRVNRRTADELSALADRLLVALFSEDEITP